MGDTVLIETTADEVVSIVTAGPQGPSGSEAATLTTTGDLLYRAALANDRLPIGSEGQVLKVSSGLPAWAAESGAVTSVAGRTGDVTLAVADVANAVSDSDARLADARTPTTHAASHAAAGSDPVFDQDLNTTDVVVFNGIKSDAVRTLTLQVTDDIDFGFSAEFTTPSLTDDREFQFPDASGTIALEGHTHAASDITSGTLAHERGGLEADVSAYDGLVKISGGATSAVTVTTAGEALLDDADAAAQRTTLGLGTVASSNSYTDLDNQPSIPSASSATPQALGAATAGSSTDYSRADHVHPLAGLPVEYVIACSDETSDLTTGTAKVTFRAPVAFLLTGVAASVNTAPTGSTLIVDINNGANSALSTKLSIDASEKTSATAATAAVIDTSYDDFAADAEITIDIDQIGSTVAGAGLKVILKGTRA